MHIFCIVVFQAEGRVSVKASKWEPFYCGGTAWRPVWLEESDPRGWLEARMRLYNTF